jgi:mannose-6-phosphate isomerase-like protein (cupin superfamily)
MKPQNHTRTPTSSGFVVAADQGQRYWFLNTLTIAKVSSDQCNGQLNILDHRVPPGFAPPPHLHHHTDEALLILDGQLDGFCEEHRWQAGPGSLVFMPRAFPHGFTVSDAGPGRIIIVTSPAASTSSSRPQASQPRTCACPSPPRPTPPASHDSQRPTASRSYPRRGPDDPSQASARLPAPGITPSTTRSARLNSEPPRRP